MDISRCQSPLVNRLTTTLTIVLLGWWIALYHFSDRDNDKSSVVTRLHGVTWTHVLPHLCSLGKEHVHPFTQGLLFTGQYTLLESSGLHSKSFLREFSLLTGLTLRRVDLPYDYFAEGVALVVEPSTLRLHIMVLTYTNNVVLVYDYETFRLSYMYRMNYIGFGLTSNYYINCLDLGKFVKRQRVWMTTGGSELISIGIPSSFSTGSPTVEGAVSIMLNGWSLRNVNEMDFNHKSGTIYANIWQSNYIVEIDADTGNCINMWDLTSIASQQPHDSDVMNGIACHPLYSGCIITGKLWPYLYNVEFNELGLTTRDIPSIFYDTFCNRPAASSGYQEVS
ncbi:uncharacterized protein BXIN_0219 [Babesia sp. Xinjiang]|uniref:uncharacterized protein n=1 Tax=Babesia sp. Xinjiang TaxID=462227 RepID=UPI000A247655|nr:uncharacterized protein BXIN_0219 [Babesia sp. Xinjiang]ORM39851.1 hypothetical protein BXIN_0219 [Babesia sp. Xinjiang]